MNRTKDQLAASSAYAIRAYAYTYTNTRENIIKLTQNNNHYTEVV